MTPRTRHPPPRDIFELELDGERLVVISIPVEAERLGTLAKVELEVALDAVAGLSNRAIAVKRGRAMQRLTQCPEMQRQEQRQQYAGRAMHDECPVRRMVA